MSRLSQEIRESRAAADAARARRRAARLAPEVQGDLFAPAEAAGAPQGAADGLPAPGVSGPGAAPDRSVAPPVRSPGAESEPRVLADRIAARQRRAP